LSLSRVCGLAMLAVLLAPDSARSQNRGVYPLGMSAVGSGNLPESGFTYSNQLLFYSRDTATGDDGQVVPVTGKNAVLMDMNSFTWVSTATMLGGARYSATVTIPIAGNNLASEQRGTISAGSGLADSYYLPLILGWTRERIALKTAVGVLAPTGGYKTGANDNVGSGYWTPTISSGQTIFLTSSKSVVLSVYQLYEFHTEQKGTGIHPGDTFDLDYSVMTTVPVADGSWLFQFGLAGYEARQTTPKTGPDVTPAQSSERYVIHGVGVAAAALMPGRKFNLGLKYFEEFATRSTYQGFSLQISGGISF
jgi:hypothetical protein